MDLRRWLILASGVTGILLVALCPSWYYLPHPSMLEETSIGYRFITQPPRPLSVVKVENAKRSFYSNQMVVPRVDRVDLASRILLIIAITVWGLWIVRRLPQIENRRKHWILIILTTVGLILAADIQIAGNAR
jgi:hypothetical protein